MSDSKHNPTKNLLKAGLKNNIIEIKIICTSEEVANKIFDVLESSVMPPNQLDLEQEWNKSDE